MSDSGFGWLQLGSMLREEGKTEMNTLDHDKKIAG
jgi:hypothetical protein